MSAYAYVRRGARAGICVLALGVTAASAQEPPAANPPANTEKSTPAASDSAAPPATQAAPPASTAPTSNLPELVVDGQDKKKKAVKTNAKGDVAPTTSEATTEAPPPGVTLGTTAPSDTGTTTFDANNVKLRTDGGSDANTFMRNLPNVQYQNSNSANPGASSSKTVDTKPALLSISGGRTYENNFIVNGVSVSNITGPASGQQLQDDGSVFVDSAEVAGMSPQNIYVPAEFVGDATIIDSNASAEYGQFMGGVVEYNLTAPPTDRYHASVSASRDTSDFANYILATPDGTNPTNRAAPSYVKNTLAVSVGAPITSDFAFIAQASRKEAESSKPKAIQIGGNADEYSDNIFLRFAATARTDIGKFTFDTSRTDYTQHWEYYLGRGMYIDTATEGTSTQLKYEADLAGMRADEIGLGRVKLTSRAFYNTNESKNNSGGSMSVSRAPPYSDWCYVGGFLNCAEGGYGNKLQSQTDFGAKADLAGDLLLGTFLLGTELKSYTGRQARLDDFVSAQSVTTGSFTCSADEPFGGALCSSGQYIGFYSLYGARDVSATVNAAHTYAEIDQTWEWFNVRAGARYDYDDYMKNHNIAPRLVGTIKPFDGLSLTAGYNRYYIGETLYYAVRDKQPGVEFHFRGAAVDNGDGTTTPGAFGQPFQLPGSGYTTVGLNTPYSDEYTGALGIRDPLFNGQWRFRYLERHGDDQFATVECGFGCTKATNDGDNFYRSASAEYTKEWYGLRNPFNLNAAAITGNVTWSEQRTAHGTYLLNSDVNGDGTAETGIWYNGKAYRPEAFTEVTGNLDIPVRFGATLATRWFDDFLELNFSAGINLGFQGVYDKAEDVYAGDIVDGQVIPDSCANGCSTYEDRKFGASLKLDVNGQINVTEQAAIQFSVNNITNSTQQTVTTESLPWVLGRSYWLGSSLRF